jgi:hypothetical protein
MQICGMQAASFFPTRRQCLFLIGAGMVSWWGVARTNAAEDPRTSHRQFDRYGVDQETITVVTLSGHYDFLVALLFNPGTPDSAFKARPPVQPDEGMLYMVPVVQSISISNHGVPFPTDLLFISRDGRVVEIHSSIMANDSQIYSSRMPVKAALQVSAGTVARIGASPGDYVLNTLFGRTI